MKSAFKIRKEFKALSHDCGFLRASGRGVTRKWLASRQASSRKCSVRLQINDTSLPVSNSTSFRCQNHPLLFQTNCLIANLCLLVSVSKKLEQHFFLFLCLKSSRVTVDEFGDKPPSYEVVMGFEAPPPAYHTIIIDDGKVTFETESCSKMDVAQHMWLSRRLRVEIFCERTDQIAALLHFIVFISKQRKIKSSH